MDSLSGTTMIISHLVMVRKSSEQDILSTINVMSTDSCLIYSTIHPDFVLLHFRRRLNVCPLLEGEDQLRLLNLQHNMITQIQHLGALRRLIFLDLYDNMITEISGLQSLSSLRVLMLGKNRYCMSTCT